MSKDAGCLDKIAIPGKFNFHIIRVVNKQNTRFRGIENPPTKEKVSLRYENLMVSMNQGL